jgi:3',5'-cyclic AMP phosphodiesterase CpdA
MRPPGELSTIFAICLALGWQLRLSAQDKPAFTFAAVADIQYADKDPAEKRQYRESVPRLERCIADLNSRDLAFVIQLGDLIDEGPANLDRILPIYQKGKAPLRHVIGNHDAASVNRRLLLSSLGLANGYYEFTYPGWRFMVLDSMDLSVRGGWPKSSDHYKEALKLFESLQAAKAPNAVDWNGGVGERQMRWLASALERAGQKKERVVVFCHQPVCQAASSPAHLLWNHAQVLQQLDASKAVVAYICGHDHSGGYAVRRGVHHVTLPGMVEAPETAYAIIEVYADRLQVNGVGSVTSRTLKFAR